MNTYILEPITAFAYGPKTIKGVITPYIRARPYRKYSKDVLKVIKEESIQDAEVLENIEVHITDKF